MLDQRERGTQFLSLNVRSVLNSPATTGMGFWSINPYVGCEFGCTYCYARDTHRWTVERARGRADGSRGGAATVARLREADPGQDRHRRAAGAHAGPVQAGPRLRSSSAPPPIRTSRRSGATGSPAAFSRCSPGIRGLRIEIISKSPLVTRDIDLLQRLSERHEVTVNVSLSTLDARLARRLELRSPVPSARLRGLAGSARRESTPDSSSPRSSPAVTDDARGTRPADGGGEGGGCPLRDRVGAPTRPRGAAPLPSPHRPRVPRPRRALSAPLRRPRRA